MPPLVAVFLAVASTGALVAEQAPELRQAAERGDADAQFDLGEAYYEGEGVDRTTSQPPRGGVVRPHLEALVVVRQRLGEREDPPDGLLRPAETRLDPPGLDRDALGQTRKERLERLDGHGHPDPGEPGLPDLVHDPLPPRLLATEGRRRHRRSWRSSSARGMVRMCPVRPAPKAVMPTLAGRAVRVRERQDGSFDYTTTRGG